MTSLVHRLVNYSASCLKLPLLAEHLLTGPMRLLRLALLRSRINGRVPATTQFDGPVRTGGLVRLQVGEHCRFGRNSFLETNGDGRIEIGDHVRINTGCVLVAYESITIGSDCLIGEYVSIRDANHGIDPGELIRLQPHVTAPIRIGQGVWIGRGVAILKGVAIGSGAVIGANSVVTRDVPPLAVAAGSPARILRSRARSEKTGSSGDPGFAYSPVISVR